MALFELFIPAADPTGFNVTVRVRADSWMQALRAGLAKLGDTADIRNVIVDITEQGIEVTEPHSGRVFRIAEKADPAVALVSGVASQGTDGLSAAVMRAIQNDGAVRPTAPAPAAQPVPAAAPQPVPAATPQPVPAAAAQPVPAAAPQAVPAAAAQPVPAATPQAVPAATPQPAQAAAPQPHAAPAPPTRLQPPPVSKAPPRAAPSAAALAAARPAAAAASAAPPAAPRFVAQVQEEAVAKERVSAAGNAAMPAIGRSKGQSAVSASDDVLSDLFAQTQALYDQSDLRGAAAYILDLAMKSVQADSGAVFIADINASDLYFAAARGPKAQEAMKFRVPMGQGIVGFCAQEGVSLAVSDVHRDPRFYAAVSKNIGYETRSILCVPAQVHGRVVGAIELINKQAGTSFTGGEISVLNFLAHEFADYMLNTEQTGA